jgi:hypothetical protein
MKTISALKRKVDELSERRQAHGLEDDDLEELRGAFRDIADLAAKTNQPTDACVALANLCMLLANESPAEVITLAEKFFLLRSASNDWLKMHVEDALSVAYNHLLDEISARQHRARSIALSKKILDSNEQEEAVVRFWTLHAAFRYADIQIPRDEQYAVSLHDGQDLADWLSEKMQISTADVQPTFWSVRYKRSSILPRRNG